MTGKERRQFRMLVRVRNFGATNTALFAALPVAQQTFAAIGAAVDDLTATDMKKMSASASARADRRAAARRALIDLLQNSIMLAKNLRAEGRAIAGFVLPASRSDVSLVTAGRQFAVDAAAVEAEFAGHGMSPAHIAAVTAAFDSAMNDQGLSRSQHIAASTRIRDLLAAATRGAQRLDLIVDNELRHDNEVQAQWTQLRRLEDSGSRSGTPDAAPATGDTPETPAATAA